MDKNSTKLHPIIILDYIPRFVGQAFVAIVCITALIGQNRSGILPDLIAFVQGIIWPHVALFLSIRSKNPKSLEFKLLFLDSFYVGAWMAYLHFSLWPTIMFVSATFMANLSVQGVKLGIQSIIANTLGAIML